jgi:hypothetical protein
MKKCLLFLLSASALAGAATTIQGQTDPASTVSPGNQNATAQAQAVQQPGDFTFSAGEVLKLRQNGINDEVIRSYIANCGFKFQLSATDIIYLGQVGLPSPLIAAMIQHDQQIPAPAPMVAAAPAPVMAVAPDPAPAQPVQTTQSVVVEQPAAPAVTYVTPYYGYPYGYPYYGYPYFSGYYGPRYGFGIGVAPFVGLRFGGHGGFRAGIGIR